MIRKTSSRSQGLQLLLVVSALSFDAALGQSGSPAPSSTVQSIPATPIVHMSETLRAEVRNTVVVAGESPASEEISGTYDTATPGLIGGMNEGSRLGTISQEIGGVNVNFPVPILTIPGAIYGGLSGATKREIQEFRDALTEELAEAESKPLTNYGLSLDVYREITGLPGRSAKLFAPTTPIPEETDGVLFVSFQDIGIDVDGHEAILTVAAKATLRRADDGMLLFETIVRYQDRDTLSNWTDNDNALWQDYANYAAHYLAREIAAALFGGVELEHSIAPNATPSAKPDRKVDRQFVSKSLKPELAWQLTLGEENTEHPWSSTIGETDIYYDVEIYDPHRLVYTSRRNPDPIHTLGMELEPCKTYWWSVRPSYDVDGETRYGDWMRFDNDTEAVPGIGLVGRQASAAPAYIQDFPQLKIKCGRR